jgi:hypothetical protein
MAISCHLGEQLEPGPAPPTVAVRNMMPRNLDAGLKESVPFTADSIAPLLRPQGEQSCKIHQFVRVTTPGKSCDRSPGQTSRGWPE